MWRGERQNDESKDIEEFFVLFKDSEMMKQNIVIRSKEHTITAARYISPLGDIVSWLAQVVSVGSCPNKCSGKT